MRTHGRGTRAFGLLAAAALGAAGCASSQPPPPPAADPDLAASLVHLGERALERGDLADARDRFERALLADPETAAARIGLGRVALAAGRDREAAGHFEAALEHAPGSADALLGLAQAAERSGHLEAARERYGEAVRADPARPAPHAALAELSGPAPRRAAVSLGDALERARRHPYDVRAGVRAAEMLAAAGRDGEAVTQLEGVLWLADLDPASAAQARELLSELDPAWRARRTVGVHAFADERIRAQPGWKFRVRLAWLAVSRALRPVLDVHFVPLSIGSFEARGTPHLDALVESFRSRHEGLPASGVVALFTETRPARLGGARLGLARFLGRELIVRLEPETGLSRVLAHELLHLYGAVHVTGDVRSLMNPAGDALVLDPMNARIVRELRDRRFAGGDVESDVLPFVDVEGAIAAYEDVLRLNLALRRAGVAEALATAERSPYEAARMVRQVGQLDEHLGDVARFVASLLLRDERPASAIIMLELASRLYGPRSAAGRDAFQEAERLRAAFRPRPRRGE